MTNITERENKLFEYWGNGQKSFIKDGVANEKRWDDSECKILFLLREVNDCDNDFDERHYLDNYNNPECNYMSSPTIENIRLWAYGINKMDEWKNWNAVERKCRECDVLSSIAVVNLKKSSGVGTVDWSNFEKYFKDIENQKNIKRQLDIYSPDIVICGGTAYYLGCLYPERFKEEKWKSTTRGIRYLLHNETIYIDFTHPNVRAPRNMIYFSLLDALDEIKKK